MNSTELKKAKRDVRRAMIAARDALGARERHQGSREVAERFLELPEVASARTVMAFWSFGSELDTMPLLEGLLAEGVRIALPRIENGALEPRSWRPGEPMTGTRFGALEPAAGDPVVPGEIDIIATPAVAFDRCGRRVGYGGGFYDRFFLRARADALRTGVGFRVQLVDADLPAGRFDLRVDVVITEAEIVRCARKPFERIGPT